MAPTLLAQEPYCAEMAVAPNINIFLANRLNGVVSLIIHNGELKFSLVLFVVESDAILTTRIGLKNISG